MRLCIIMSGKAIGERNDDAVRFLAAEMQALRFATSHREEALKLARETISAKPEDPRPAFIYDQIVGHKDIDVEMKIPLDKIRWMQDQLVKDGSLPKPIDLAKVTDDSLRAKALARAAQ